MKRANLGIKLLWIVLSVLILNGCGDHSDAYNHAFQSSRDSAYWTAFQKAHDREFRVAHDAAFAIAYEPARLASYQTGEPKSYRTARRQLVEAGQFNYGGWALAGTIFAALLCGFFVERSLMLLLRRGGLSADIDAILLRRPLNIDLRQIGGGMR